jgi:hypothetical protein
VVVSGPSTQSLSGANVYRDAVRYLTAAETSPLNHSILNRPIGDVANNIAYLKAIVEAMGAADNLVQGKPCLSSVAVGMPVAWNSTTAQFEPALAGSKSSLGLCVAKSSATIADVRLLGYAVINLEASTGAANPTAGLYYLSQTVAGMLEATRPLTGVQQPVLFADGVGGAYLVYGEYTPMPGPQGIPGATGATGATGNAGEQGASGPAALPVFAHGRWYAGPINYAPTPVNSNYNANTLVAVPFAAPGGAVISDLAVKVLAAGNPGDEGRLGIYADNGLYPGELITAANGVFNGASAGAKVISVNQTTLVAGRLVWLVMAVNSSVMGISSRLKDNAWAFKGWSDGLQDPALGYTINRAYGSMPEVFPSNADELIQVVPTIYAKTV